jgi:hypothetical protein
MRPRPIFVLPAGENLSDFDFVPSPEEKAATKEVAKRKKHAKRCLVNLANLQKLWEREEAAYLKHMDALRQKHIAAILVQAERDRIWLAQMNAWEQETNAWEQEIDRRRNFYLSEHDKEAKAIHAARLKKLATILDDIRKTDCRLERKELTKRGVVRGRKSEQPLCDLYPLTLCR